MDLNPVIKNRNSGTSTANKIEIKSEGDSVANVMIKDLNIATESDTSDNGIKVVKKSNALITLAGVNTIKSNNGYLAVRVSRGRLGITGDGTLNAEATSTFNEMGYLIQGAAIGTESYENLQESITIGGNAIVNAKVLDRVQENKNNIQGAPAIGTGAEGSISETGLIAIIDNAKVNANAIGDGAGIGVGRKGISGGKVAVGTDEPDAMTGTIRVIGNYKLVIGVDASPTGNGITADSEANLMDILEKFAEIERLDATNYTQVESPVDLLAYNANADQAKLPVSQWNTLEEPEVPGDPDNNDNNNVPGDTGNNNNNVSDEIKGSVENNSVVIKTPEATSAGTVRTGDSANVALLMLMLACSLFSIYGVRNHRSKR